MGELTHFGASGEARMVDVGDKSETRRVAVAAGEIVMEEATLALVPVEDSFVRGYIILY